MNIWPDRRWNYQCSNVSCRCKVPSGWIHWDFYRSPNETYANLHWTLLRRQCIARNTIHIKNVEAVLKTQLTIKPVASQFESALQYDFCLLSLLQISDGLKTIALPSRPPVLFPSLNSWPVVAPSSTSETFEIESRTILNAKFCFSSPRAWRASCSKFVFC